VKRATRIGRLGFRRVFVIEHAAPVGQVPRCRPHPIAYVTVSRVALGAVEWPEQPAAQTSSVPISMDLIICEVVPTRL
jgi:hypothetical protein